MVNKYRMILETALPFEINHDWDRTRAVYAKLISQYQQGFFANTTQSLPDYHAVGADLGQYGRLSISNDLTQGTEWYIWSGEFLEMTLPFAQQLKQQIQEAGLKFCNFAYFQHENSIKRHVDKKALGEQNDPDDPQANQCNLNFIISCDDHDSKSYWQDHDGTHVYPSQAGHAWLIDSSQPHWVDNCGHREIFQIRFHDNYRNVHNYFQNHSISFTC